MEVAFYRSVLESHGAFGAKPVTQKSVAVDGRILRRQCEATGIFENSMRAVKKTVEPGVPQACFALGFEPVAEKNVAIDIRLVARKRVAARIFESAAAAG